MAAVAVVAVEALAAEEVALAIEVDEEADEVRLIHIDYL